MLDYSDSYREQLKSAWEHFVQGEDGDYSCVRPEILKSWERSREHGVNPYEIKSIIYSEDDIKRNLESHKKFIQIVRPYMEQIYSIVKNSGFYIMLCDDNGIILDLIGDESIIDEAKNGSNLIVGANRNESFAGTNAIGTCLAMGEPVQIWSEEHYVSPHKKYTCSAGPIYAADDKLLGCINLTGLDDKVHPHTLGMVLSAVDGISKELKIRSAYSDIEDINAQKNIILESVDSGFMILDENDMIVQMSNLSKKMLGLDKDITGECFFDYFSIADSSDEDHRFSKVAQDIIGKEVNYYAKNTSLPPIKLVTTIKINSSNGSHNAVVKLDESSRIHKITSKVSGYKAHFSFKDIIGESSRMKKMIDLAMRGAETNSNVLILGESGTGKEMVAQSIHNASSYASGPFIAINCAALPNGLIESELFGYEGGAFTGASKDGSPGKFELADGGTIFLDEIGDMPLDVQASLLRVIQSKEIVRIGAKYSKKIDVRIITATNTNLQEAVENKTFRNDLFYRINVMTVNMPPLKERGNDIVVLSEYFLNQKMGIEGQRMNCDDEVLDILMKYDWPGNVRELENTIERAVNLAEGNSISVADLHPHIVASVRSKSGDNEIKGENTVSENVSNKVDAELDFNENNKKMILASLEKTDGNVKKAAELLGISRRTLYRKMDKLNIDYSQYR